MTQKKLDKLSFLVKETGYFGLVILVIPLITLGLEEMEVMGNIKYMQEIL